MCVYIHIYIQELAAEKLTKFMSESKKSDRKLRQEIEQKREECEKLQQEWEKTKDELIRCQEQKDREMSALRAELERSKTMPLTEGLPPGVGDGDQRAQLATLQQEVVSLKLKLEEEGAGRREAEARADNLQAFKDKLTAEEEQRRYTGDQTGRMSELEQQNLQLSSELEEAKQRLGQAESMIEEMKERFAREKEQFDEVLQKRAEEEEQKLALHKAEWEKLKGKLKEETTASREECDALQGDMDLLKKQLAESETRRQKVAAQQAAQAQDEAEHAKKNDAIQQLKKDNEKLQVCVANVLLMCC